MAVEAVFGGATVWHSEIDKAASKVLAYRWPDVPNLGSITEIDWAAVEPVDVLCGGFPCQDLSLAGKRSGISDGTRSGLWAEMARVIEIHQPKYVVIENVKGLLSGEAHRTVESRDTTLGDRTTRPVLRAIGAVLGDLWERGYDAQWATVSASSVGAPHTRDRVFILATHPALAGLEGREFQPAGYESSGQRDREAAYPVDRLLLATPQARDRRGEPKAGFCLSSLPRDVLKLVDGWGDYEPAIRLWESLTRPAPAAAEPSTTGKPRVRSEFSEWMMGWPAGWVTDLALSRTEKLMCVGNGVVPQQAAAALRYLLSVCEVGA